MKVPNKIYIPFYPNDDGLDTHLGTDWFDSKDIDQYVEGWNEYINKDTLIDKLYKWMEEDTTVADYYSKEQFKKVIDSMF